MGDFIRDIIDADLASGRHQRVATRFPPEPNGYLHIGHAKSICLNFGIARDYQGSCNLRYDDTNPTKEEVEYVESIERDVRWLGFAPAAVLYASDYFEQMYELAVRLVRDGNAYVCSLSEDDIRAYRGSLSEPGRPSPGRARSVAENLDLFTRMRAGEFPDGAHVLRARGDLAAANMKMRDPLLYRIRHAHHHRTGDRWCIYPMYDYAHPLSDAIEDITHSICTLEFENNRELYDWVIEKTGVSAGKVAPRQYEFARLNIDFTVMSKRKLLQLVEQRVVSGWDDPRMPTIAGMRRRGYRPEAIRAFCEMIGVAKNNSVVDLGKLEYCVRDDLNQSAPRAMAVLRPLRVVLTNLAAPTEVPGRQLMLRGEIAIERDDFRDSPEKGFQRLAPGRVVRLRHSACIVCDEVVRGADGAVSELHCRVVDDTDKVGVIHWVPIADAVRAEVRLYDRMFQVPRPDEDGDFAARVSERSLEVLTGCLLEPGLAAAAPGARYQFERQGYFIVDEVDSRPGALVWNRIVGLRDAQPAAEAPPPEPEKKKPAAAAAADGKVRPARRSRAEYRAEARARDPELAAQLARYQAELGLSADEADLLTGERATAALFEATAAACGSAPAAARFITQSLPPVLAGRAADALPFGGVELGALVAEVEAGRLSGAAAKEVLARMADQGGHPRDYMVAQVSDAGALDALVADALAKHPDKAAEYRGGRKGLLGFFVGAVVKASGGSANPQVVKQLVEKRLS